MKQVLVSLGVVGALASCAAFAQEKASNFYVGAGYGVIDVPDVEGIKFSDANNGFIQLGYKITENFAIEGQYSKSLKDSSDDVVIEDIDVSYVWWSELEAYGWSSWDAQAVFPYAVMDLTAKVEASLETTAIYGVYRSSGDLYFKIKAGYLKEKATLKISPTAFDFYAPVAENVTPNDPVVFSGEKGDELFDMYVGEASEKVSASESGFSAGLGVGYKISERFFSELEYTSLSDDLDMYSLSINFAF